MTTSPQASTKAAERTSTRPQEQTPVSSAGGSTGDDGARTAIEQQ